MLSSCIVGNVGSRVFGVYKSNKDQATLSSAAHVSISLSLSRSTILNHWITFTVCFRNMHYKSKINKMIKGPLVGPALLPKILTWRHCVDIWF